MIPLPVEEVLYDREKTIDAWHCFIERGEIPEGCVRHPVADSWRRCRELGVDPFAATYPHLSRSRLQHFQSHYASLLRYAIPCMHLLHCLTGSGGVSLTSPELFTYYMISEYESDPLSYGVFLDEATCGNTAVSIAAHEHATAFLHKYEKYRLVDQSSSSAATPILLRGEPLAYLAINSTSGLSEELMISLVERTAACIAQLLDRNPTPAEARALIREMIALAHRPIFLMDSQGRILEANRDCARFIRVQEADGSPAALSDSLVDRGDLMCFLPGEEYGDQKSCNIRTIYNNTFNCEIVFKSILRFPGLEDLTVISLAVSLPGQQVRARSGSALLSLPARIDNADYVGESIAWSKIDGIVKKVAQFPSNVLLQGESGTGKEVVARAIHRLSGRSGKFVAINCGDIPEGLLQSELFGYEKGAFTGANREGSMGKFEYADHGTVFLDEIGDMPLPMQVSLLRFLQERTVQRIGSNKQKLVDVRIIAATNKNIEQMVREKQFRSDLYYRLNIIGITLPLLRERKEDIPLLMQHFLRTISAQYGLPVPTVDQDVYPVLMRYDWPGNVRELRNVAEKLLIMSEQQHISVRTLYTYIFDYDRFNSALSGETRLSEEAMLRRTLSDNHGNISKTAAELGIARDTLYRKMRKYGIPTKRA